MNFKKSTILIQSNNSRDLDNARDYHPCKDLIIEQKVSKDNENTVHHRRDLDALG